MGYTIVFFEAGFSTVVYEYNVYIWAQIMSVASLTFSLETSQLIENMLRKTITIRCMILWAQNKHNSIINRLMCDTSSTLTTDSRHTIQSGNWTAHAPNWHFRLPSSVTCCCLITNALVCEHFYITHLYYSFSKLPHKKSVLWHTKP